MPRASAQRLLRRLSALKLKFDRDSARGIQRLLRQLRDTRINSTSLLIDFHETLLFLRAYPQNASILRAAESQLQSFATRVHRLVERGTDTSDMEHPELSGIADLPVIDTFTFDIVNWLVRVHPDEVDLSWEWFEDENRLGEAWTRYMPLLADDSSVEAHVPYREWLEAVKGERTGLAWLVQRFNELPLSDSEKAASFNAQQLYVEWKPAYEATRTGLRLKTDEVFFHRGPLIQRRDVDFQKEMEALSPEMRLLDAQAGESILNLAREASTVRYRELYGFTHGDPQSVYQVELGRGVDLFVIVLPPSRRLPLRAYHGAMIFKNGMPVGYFEGLSLCERMESGFNLYYTFREGETAWLYARTLNVMRNFTGARSFALDPYQIGHENEEGIASGAFWFYRKLGFRPTDSAALELTRKEERKLASRKGYRSSAATLRKLAVHPVILELDDTSRGVWDHFSVRQIGLAVQRKIGAEFDGSSLAMRQSSVEALERLLRIKISTWSETEAGVFADFAVVVSLIPGTESWSKDERQLMLNVIRAKGRGDESTYLRLMTSHAKLRDALISLGSTP